MNPKEKAQLRTVGPSYWWTVFDRALKPYHRKMVFSAYLSGFGITPHVLMSTDFATTMPECVARLHQQHFPLATLRMPKPLDRIRISMAWTRRQHTSPLHGWMRAGLRKAIAAHTIG